MGTAWRIERDRASRVRHVGRGGGQRWLSASLPPMGLRVRLKATANLNGLPHDARVIAVALQRYGMILADNGSPWYVSGMSDPAFDDDVLHELDRFTGADVEVVDTSGLVNGS